MPGQTVHVNAKLQQGLVGGTIAFTQPSGTSITGYVSPNLQGLAASHKATVDRIPNQGGRTGALIINDEYIELTFDYFPQGSTDAASRASATLPEPGSKAAVSGLPIIQIGTFVDGLNTNGSSTQPWIYEGEGGDVSGKAKEKWDGKISLRRYTDIPSGAAYTLV